MRASCGSPISPAATAAATASCAGSKRRLKPIWNGTPAASTAASARSTSARSSDTGFSQKIALPAPAAATISSACVSVGEQMATASTSGALSSSSRSAATTAPSASATVRALASNSSWIQVTAAPGTWRSSSSACMRPIRPTPSTPIRSVPVATAISLLPQGHDILPGARLDGPQQRGLDRHPVERLREPDLVRAALDDRAQILEVLDHDQVLEADAVRRPRHERAVVGEAVAAVDGRIARGRIVRAPVVAQPVEVLEVPAHGAVGAVDVERHLALGADDRPAGLERAARAVGELAQYRRVVLVGHLAVRILGPAAAVVAGARERERALADERLDRPHQP